MRVTIRVSVRRSESDGTAAAGLGYHGRPPPTVTAAPRLSLSPRGRASDSDAAPLAGDAEQVTVAGTRIWMPSATLGNDDATDSSYDRQPARGHPH